MSVYLYMISTTAAALFAATEAAYAGFLTTPGPVAAVGAPALLVIGGAFMAVRYLRSRAK